MTEDETRAELIDPKLKASGWGVVDDSKVFRNHPITAGRIQTGGKRGQLLRADYVLAYKGVKLAVVEAKSDHLQVGEGVAQAKLYAEKMRIETAYATNGKEIYSICMKTAAEGLIANFPTPEELWNKTFADVNEWRDKFASVPFEDKSGSWQPRYYQEIAVQKTMQAIADKKQRILLTLATGTGKTAIAFQIAWKLFHTRWNLSSTSSDNAYLSRRPNILFLADRNILANQAYNEFSAFSEESRVRIKPGEIKKKGYVPTNGNIFFTIFQTFMSGGSTGSPTALVEVDIKFDEIQANVVANGFMYILQCNDGSFYTGSTNDLVKRIEQHKNGEGAEYTKLHAPVKLVYYETFDRIDFAFEREKQIQKWSRAKKIALIKGDIEELKKLSKNKFESIPKHGESSEKSTKFGEPFESSEKSPKFGEPVEPYFGDYPADYFDFIIIDECHRGGANDESNWREILEYFSPAVQLGLTATPKRKDNVDTYKYFGEPVYIYSLKEGINDGFLTPFKVKRISTTLDDYIYTSDDQVIEGEIEEGRLYTEPDFNRIIEIKAREAKRVQVFMNEINQNEKAIVFCATQDHAAAIRDLINQDKKSKDPNYCVRVTANDGELGEQYLREFQDNEKTIPTILTTSQKLSTGVDARNIRNIVLLRPVNTMIEFKQIVGRGTRLFDGKEFFTLYDFVDAFHHFKDPEWDGEPIPPDEPCKKCGQIPCVCERTAKPCPECNQVPCICITEPKQPCYKCGQQPCVCIKKVKVKLRDGKEREIQHMIATSFWSADGKPISAEEFLNNLFGELPNLFKSEEELRQLWSNPLTRKTLLEKLDQAGFGKGDLIILQQLIDAEKSDLFDVLEYVFNSSFKPITREARVAAAQATIFALLNNKQKEFIEFVLTKYIETGVEELDQEKLPILLTTKYQSFEDAGTALGDLMRVKDLFIEFQKYLYGVA